MQKQHYVSWVNCFAIKHL